MARSWVINTLWVAVLGGLLATPGFARSVEQPDVRADSPAPQDEAWEVPQTPLLPSPVPLRVRSLYQKMSNPMVGNAANLAKGRLLYQSRCRVCHEAEPGSAGLSTEPARLSSANFHNSRTDGEIFYAIRNGIPGTAMLPWGGRFSDRDIWLLVVYLRSLRP